MDEVVVSVTFNDQGKTLARAEVSVLLVPGEPLRVGLLVDACQRSVAHCIDELQKDLDI